MNRQEKHNLIVELLKADPIKSNRRVALQASCDHKTVCKVRNELVECGEITHIPHVVDTLGRMQQCSRDTTLQPQKLNLSDIINKIHRSDCLKFLRKMPDECVDLIFTSPPYNLKYHKTRKGKFNPYDDAMPEAEYQAWQVEVLNECYRVLKPNGSLWYNHKNRFYKGVQITPYEWLLKTDFIIKQEIVWQNGTPLFDRIRFYPFTERLYWLTKSPNTKMYNTISHIDVFTRKEWKREGTKGVHKRAFPVKLVTDILSCFENAYVVFDPFMGSGTTAIAALEMSRKFIGIELSPKYCKLATQRIQEYKSSLGVKNAA